MIIPFTFIKRSACCLFFLSSLCTTSLVQSQGIQGLFDRVSRQYLEENLGIQPVRYFFKKGEPLQFQVYYLARPVHELRSGILYVDVLDNNNKVKAHKVYRLNGAVLPVSISLPDSITGVYTLRAYTRASIEKTKPYYAESAVMVYGNKDEPEKWLKQKTIAAGNSRLVFFPEGGYLLQGYSNRVGILANNAEGFPVAVQGQIMNAANQAVASFTTGYDGMASVDIEGSTDPLKAVWQENGQQHTVSLPAAAQDAAALACDVREGGITFTVKRTENYTRGRNFYVVAHSNYQLLYQARFNMENETIISGFIPLKQLPGGVVQLELLDAEFNKLSDRLVWAGLKQRYNGPAGLTVSQPEQAGAIWRWEVSSTDTTARLLYSRLHTAGGLPVFLPASLFLDASAESPVAAFAITHPQADSVARQLDQLLRMSKWRGLSVKSILAGDTLSATQVPEQSLAYRGKVAGGNSKEEPLFLVLTDKQGIQKYLNVQPDKSGEFYLGGLQFEDTVKLTSKLVSTGKKNSTLPTIQITPLYIKEAVSLPAARINYTQLLAYWHREKEQPAQVVPSIDNATNDGKVKMLEEVKVTGKTSSRAEQLNNDYSSGAFQRTDNVRMIVPEEDPYFLSALSILDYLDGRVPGLLIDRNVMENAVSWRGQVTAIFVDEISQQMPSSGSDIFPAEDARLLRSIPMADIALVKIIPPPFVGTWGNGPGGALIVYTKKGADRRAANRPKGIDMAGYSSPSGTAHVTSVPLLLSGSNNKGTIEWPRAAATGQQQLILEGVDAMGRLILAFIY